MSSKAKAFYNFRMTLAQYHVDPVTGFVPPTPSRFGCLHHTRRGTHSSPSCQRSSAQGACVGYFELPVLEPGDLVSPGDQERALLLLTHLANAWVWGDDQPDLRLTRSIAVPLCALAVTMGRPPIAHYATTTLYNWRLVDPRQPLSVDNARQMIQFLGGVDEEWFFIASMGVELAGAHLIPVMVDAVRASQEGDDDRLVHDLRTFREGMRAVVHAMEHVRTWCHPATYFLRVRPLVAGWPRPGVIYEGVSDEPQRHIGGSAGQSSLFQLFDVVLGVHHADQPAGAYLRAVRAYMPRPHRALVETMERDSQVRARALGAQGALRDAFNDAVAALASFREDHLQLAHDYVVTPSGAGRDSKGTGGTSLDDFLRAAHRSTCDAHA